MKTILITLNLLLFGFDFTSYGQETKYLEVPTEQYVPLYHPNECYGLIHSRVPQGTPWIVFSDRDGNVVFSNYGVNESIAKVEMGKRFLVISESGNNLEVVEYQTPDIKLNIVNTSFSTVRQNLLKGWIPKNRLLLSKKSLNCCNTGLQNSPAIFYPLKALVLPSFLLQRKQNNWIFGSPGSESVSRNPVLSYPDAYVMKIETIGNIRYYLLARNPIIEDSDEPENVILGWISELDLELWKSQYYLEINWTPEAVAERNIKNIRIKSFKWQSNGHEPVLPANSILYNQFPGDTLEKILYARRLNGENHGFRYPVLRNDSRYDNNPFWAICGHVNNPRIYYTRFATVSGRLTDLKYDLFKTVITLSGSKLKVIDDFIGYMLSKSKSSPLRLAIKESWYRALIYQLKIVDNMQDANHLKLNDAISILTGYPVIMSYSDLTIGDLIESSKFTDQMVFEYLAEWMITRGYIRSILYGKFEITDKYLLSNLGFINAVRQVHRKTILSQEELSALAARFRVGDDRSPDEYFRNYPFIRSGMDKNEVTYYVETSFFPSQESNFVDIIYNF